MGSTASGVMKAINTGLYSAAQQALAQTIFIFICTQPEFVTIASFVELQYVFLQNARFYGIESADARVSNVFNASLRAFASTRYFIGSEDFQSCRSSHHVSHDMPFARLTATLLHLCSPFFLHLNVPRHRVDENCISRARQRVDR
jgi:hypothetical protein